MHCDCDCDCDCDVDVTSRSSINSTFNTSSIQNDVICCSVV